MAKQSISPQTEQEALSIAKATQKPGQTKEQTKLIAKGIEKGIAEYKKRQKGKSRALDKERKKVQKQAAQGQAPDPVEHSDAAKGSRLNPVLAIALVLSLAANLVQFLTR